MKSILVLATAAFTCLASAQYYDVNSPPFRLFLKSSNSSLNGTAIGACHQGAATEGACITNERITDPVQSYTTFYHATSSSSSNNSTYDAPGLLYWNLTSNIVAPSSMRFIQRWTSNLATPIFLPGNASTTTVHFAKDCEEMYLPRGLDDTVSPPSWLTPSVSEKVQSWYVCLTKFSYLYTTLEWKVGVTGEPQNPTCQKVSVYRVFV
ncbi:hypothetical protein CC80DRAFT_488457 [Byssothecium circinans]|uniref:DUF7907 domain-containing protein n=1 Tax=Byssothecium circinans TaxID=147558 RepID=A0A6A5U872_9PLEO|nr:hypothetical protein CC80DRAFT_488457 [Byssothecium circinans]